MGERMTNEKHAFMMRLDRLTAHQQREAMADWSCARRAEREQAEVIKVLADALDAHGAACRVTLRHEQPECSCVGCSSTRALRLAGRLP